MEKLGCVTLGAWRLELFSEFGMAEVQGGLPTRSCIAKQTLCLKCAPWHPKHAQPYMPRPFDFPLSSKNSLSSMSRPTYGCQVWFSEPEMRFTGTGLKQPIEPEAAQVRPGKQPPRHREPPPGGQSSAYSEAQKLETRVKAE